jgi:alpha-tubulin suppressor-like RCC1 family protein
MLLGILQAIFVCFWLHSVSASATVGMPSIDVKSQHMVNVKADGTVWTWGYNGLGQLGDGTTTNRTTPVTVTGITYAVGAAVGSNHTLALEEDGTVRAWGYNGNGQLGDGTTTNRISLVPVSGLSNVIAVAANTNYSLALKEDGTVWAWGDNGNGQLGDGTTVSRTTRVQVLGLTNIASIVAGPNYALAVSVTGTVYGWGYNGFGQLGDGTTVSRTTPVLASISNVKQVSAGDNFVIAVLNTGSVWAWGQNDHGKLGDGAYNNRLTPVQVTGLSGVFSMAAAGPNFALALKADGTLWSWGYNGAGQLGDHSVIEHINPAQMMSGVRVISAGSDVAAAVTTDGVAWAWGDNGNGKLGRGTTVNRTIPGQVKYAAGTLSGTVSYGSFPITGATVSLLSEDGVQTAISNGSGFYTFTNLVPDVYDVTAQAATYKAASGLGLFFTSGTVKVQDFTMSNSMLATVSTNNSLASGNNFSLYINTDQTVWAWGYNNFGQLGDNTNISRTSPKQIQGLHNVVSVAAGSYYHSAALISDGTVWTWGYNGNGQLGDGTTNSRQTPVLVTGLTNITAISTGDQFTLALDTSGNVWAWGYNGYGQLGDGTTTNRNAPVQIPSNLLTNVVAISAGEHHAVALKSNGTVWTWGYNVNGQLGDNTNTNRMLPVQVTQITNGAAIAAGQSFTLVLQKDGTVLSWGNNSNGQLGDRTLISHTSPVIVPGLTNVINITAGSMHTTALKEDGTLWAWGLNNSGQLGDGTVITKPYPVQIQSLFNISKIGPQGSSHSVIMNNAGSLWAWGTNNNGQLGNGTNISSLIPVAVQTITTSTISSSMLTSALGQSVMFTASVTSNDGTPTGTVAFKDAAATLGTGTLNASGQATFATSNLSVTSHSITAVYAGAGNFAGSTSIAITQTVNAASTTSTVSSSSLASTWGLSVTFTASITSGGGTPTGTVTFKDGATTLGSGMLNASGQATFTTSNLSVTSHSITVDYVGVGNFAGSTSSAITQAVNAANTTSIVSSSSLSSTWGQSVTFTANVTSSSGTPTGTVTFKDGATTLGTGTLDGAGHVTYSTTSNLTVASHNITAIYTGAVNFAGSTSMAITQTVNAANTTSIVSSSSLASTWGQQVTFTASVTSVGGTPTGMVTFMNGAATLGTGTLNASGQATFATNNLSVASHNITAIYTGAVNFAGSTSSAITQTVNVASTTSIASVSSLSSTWGEPVTLTASVTSGGGTPTGTVTFMDGATTLGMGTLDETGHATYMTTSNFSVASHSITFVYAGAGNFAGSTSIAITLTINKSAAGIRIESSALSSTWSHSVTMSVYVDSSIGVIPTGTVTFMDGINIVQASVVLNAAGEATWTSNNLALGTHDITVHYSGNTNFDSNNSAIFHQEIVPFTDEEAVSVDLAALMIGYSAGNSETNVTYRLTLPTSGANGTVISWSSNAASIINSIGQITRPAFLAGNREVTLTAQISRGASQTNIQSKSFVVTVIRSWDVNGDGVVSVDDIVRLVNIEQDGNQDSLFNENDIVFYLNQIEPIHVLNN